MIWKVKVNSLLVICHGRKSVSKLGSFLSMIFASDIYVCSSKIQDGKFFQVNVAKICIDVQKEQNSSGFVTSSEKKIQGKCLFL